MARRKKKKQDRFEYYYCQVEEWSRSYHFGIDYSYRADPDGPPWEWNEVSIRGKVIHISDTVPERRRYKQMILNLITKNEEEADLGRISVGFAEAYEGILRCHVWLPSISFGSIIPSLERGRFKEAVVRVKNFSYRRGQIDSMDLHTEFTPDDDLM